MPTDASHMSQPLHAWPLTAPALQFQIETDDIDYFREDLKLWKHCGGFENRPPPLVIEVYMDVSQLLPSQTLVIVDDHGNRWDVLEALNSSEPSGNGRSSNVREVILERWKIELRCLPYNDAISDDFGPTLPTIYKRSIVFFRSLFVSTIPSLCLSRGLSLGIFADITVASVSNREFD